MNINGYDKILQYLLNNEKPVICIKPNKATNIHNINRLRNINKKKEVSDK